ncbi:Predicted ATP-dependent endonuclease of the OLD family, contains P-loop ATPase and TOPRIM domains [Micromonospora matsumotoense]|uniref:Predicted ATP-dependent endonuclease of the OLD family, contains P-loop ATPase and TOPRIM domains n=1 Tax=Micromonospora matsumotoense TaxID=121616 RepID=A0A1C4YAB6_9ACTN|nr:AAA family ATPase [Micromonospora matsumotoense]SCF17645.1 Predicted ATP-dependent endonuclease of the OLD family, contains P-loop ATPase and TOPRIM domains [Micromonospora matsumotoense]
MRVTKAQISKYKSVTDSGEFAVNDRLTALVGKNEAGKTAVLEAIYRFNPLASGHPTTFDPLRDYPRSSYNREKAQISAVEPIQLTFALDPDDIAAVEATFGKGSVIANHVRVARRYNSTTTYWSSPVISEAKAIGHLVEKAGLDRGKYAKQTRGATIAALRAEEEPPAAAAELAGDLEDRDLVREARTILVRRLPKIQYFDEYSVLPGSVSIERLQKAAEDDLSPGERTALALLRLAGVDSEEFAEADYEARKASLEAAANQLTDELFEYWTQNDGLSVELDIESRPVPNRPGQPEPWLQIRVRNATHRVTLNMAERSKGFIWFFSFLAAFSEYAEEDRRVILLDEPGLNLHAKAQGDLLRYIDERLAPEHQVIYSTHSLFMIQPRHLVRCRTVEDLPKQGTKVSEDVWAARPETVFPLLGALGVDMSQALIVGPDQLAVEGPADVAYLSVMSDLAREKGKTSLDPRWTITPVGGLDKIPTFVALLRASDLNIAVVMDVAAGGNQKITNMVQRGLLAQEHLIPLTDITGAAEADIEDLFDQGWYLKLLKESKVGVVAKNKLTGGRIVKQVEAVLGSRFDHYQPASYLMRTATKLRDEVDDATIDRFAQLFARINNLLST